MAFASTRDLPQPAGPEISKGKGLDLIFANAVIVTKGASPTDENVILDCPDQIQLTEIEGQSSFEAELRPIQSTSLNVCLSVCAIAETPLPEVVETSGQMASSLYSNAMTVSPQVFSAKRFF